MQTINLDLSVRSIIPLLHAKQGDVGRKFKVILTDGGVAYPVPAGAAVSVWYSSASGEGNYTDIGADSAVSVSGNEITVELITQMLANYGDGKLCLAINTADGDQIGTWNIPYMVEPLPGMGSAAAQQYFTAFSQAVENLPYPDTTLSVAGRAADAGAVGAALAGKAPAGYGLGDAEFLPDGTDLNTVTKNGWYWWNQAENAPPSFVNIMRVWTHLGGSCMQEGVGLTNDADWGTVVKRMVYSGGRDTTPWEYINPPMIPGVEYRTTERYNGKPVYKQAFEFTMPNNNFVRAYPPTDILWAESTIIGFSAVTVSASNMYPFPAVDIASSTNPNASIFAYDASGKVCFKCQTSDDRSAYTAKIIVSYVKG